MPAQVGALRVTLGANTAQFEQGMRRAQASARQTGQNITRSFDQMRVRTTQVFGAMRATASGLGIALGAGLFTAAIRDSFTFASSLSESARAMGVTVEQLQILRRGAIESGASIEGMERAVGILNRTLGQARAGVPAAVQAFRALRLDPEQFTNAGDAIPRVMEAIRGLRTQSEQAAAAQRLFGRGAQELIPLLIQGAEGYNRIAEEAREAGLVTQEQADRADEAADKMALLGESLRINLASALIDVIPLITEVIQALGGLIREASSAFSWLSRVTSFGGQSGGRSYFGTVARGMVPIIGPWLAGQYLASAQRGEGTPGTLGGVLGRVGAPTGTGDNDLDLSSGGGGRSRRGGGTDRSAEQAIRRRHDVESELNRARIEELRAQQEITTNAERRNELAQMISYLEQGQSEAERRLSVLLKDRTQAEADALADIELRAFHLRREAMDAEEVERVRSEQLEVGKASLDLQTEIQSAAADMADTASERRAVQLRLLDLAQQQERLELEGVLASREATDAQKQIAQARLDSLSSLYLYREQGVMNQTRGPLGNFLAELPTTAARANEALENVAANGLAAITDGLADAIMGARSLGDVFKSVAKQIISDLLRIQIQRSIIAPLTNALSGLLGGVAGGSSGFLPAGTGGWSGGIGAFGGGRASGGPVLPGRTYVVGERGPELLRMGAGAGYVVANDNSGGGGVTIYQTFAPSFAGNAATKQEMMQLAAMVKPMAVEAFKDFAKRR